MTSPCSGPCSGRCTTVTPVTRVRLTAKIHKSTTDYKGMCAQHDFHKQGVGDTGYGHGIGEYGVPFLDGRGDTP